jgi:hypothetical protein
LVILDLRFAIAFCSCKPQNCFSGEIILEKRANYFATGTLLILVY